MPIIASSTNYQPSKLLQPNFTTGERSKVPILIQNELSSPITLVEKWLGNLFETELKLNRGELGREVPFANVGIDSIFLAQIQHKINEILSIELDASALFSYPTIASLSSWLTLSYSDEIAIYFTESIAIESPLKQVETKNQDSTFFNRLSSPSTLSCHEPIAVIGMSCQFPGADTLDSYWELLVNGLTTINRVSENCWGTKTNYFAGLINNIYAFDPAFFMIAKEDAQSMDPQALLLLRESLSTLYHAGYTHREVNGNNTGVDIGGRGQPQFERALLQSTRNPMMVIGQNYLAANISQFFNFQGPSLVVDTACSSALVAMNMAVDALQAGKIESALVGGVGLLTDQKTHQIFERRNLLQKDGKYHILDQRASGIVLGEGVGVVYLKTLSSAERDGDTIYSVISGISINNDGRTAGHAAPNVEAQKAVMKTALNQGACRSEEVRYIDVNGSGSANKRSEGLSGKHFLRPDSWGLDCTKTPCCFSFPHSPSSFWD